MENCDHSQNDEYCESDNENCIRRPNYKPRTNARKVTCYTIPIVKKHLSIKEINYWNGPPPKRDVIPKPEPSLPWWKW